MGRWTSHFWWTKMVKKWLPILFVNEKSWIKDCEFDGFYSSEILPSSPKTGWEEKVLIFNRIEDIANPTKNDLYLMISYWLGRSKLQVVRNPNLKYYPTTSAYFNSKYTPIIAYKSTKPCYMGINDKINFDKIVEKLV